ncbi:MAG: methionine synthase [Firmicutes bacterium]|nr:methionine synthase [Bacillota bacterium]
MKLEKPLRIDIKQWLGRLGVKGQADEDLQAIMETCERQLLQTAGPQGVYRVLDLDALRLEGTAIQKHLEGCGEMAVMAATLGAGVDRMLRAAQIRDMAEALILDCGASVLIEQICDQLEGQIRQEAQTFLTGRYSPGYGDLPIETQGQLLTALDAGRKIGLTVNKSHIMIPRKSVTAVLGMADHPVTGYLATCGECALREICVLRKEGKSCAGF